METCARVARQVSLKARRATRFSNSVDVSCSYLPRASAVRLERQASAGGSWQGSRSVGMANPADFAFAGRLPLTVRWYPDGSVATPEIRFMLLPTTPLDRVMRSWCQEHNLPRAGVEFAWNWQLVFGGDTMQSLGMLNDNSPVLLAALVRAEGASWETN